MDHGETNSFCVVNYWLVRMMSECCEKSIGDVLSGALNQSGTSVVLTLG